MSIFRPKNTLMHGTFFSGSILSRLTYQDAAQYRTQLTCFHKLSLSLVAFSLQRSVEVFGTRLL